MSPVAAPRLPSASPWAAPTGTPLPGPPLVELDRHLAVVHHLERLAGATTTAPAPATEVAPVAATADDDIDERAWTAWLATVPLAERERMLDATFRGRIRLRRALRASRRACD